MVHLFSKYEKAHELQRQWKHHFNTSPPALATDTAVNRRFNETGRIEELPRTGRPATIFTEEKLGATQDMVDTNPRFRFDKALFKLVLAQVDIMLLCRNCN